MDSRSSHSVLGSRRLEQALFCMGIAVVVSLAVACHTENTTQADEGMKNVDKTSPVAAVAPASPPAASSTDPSEISTPSWLPPARLVKDADAKTEADMKSYAEPLPGSEITLEMVPIPGGKFTMGSPADEENRNDDESPQREVAVDPFWMGKCEVTWEQYEQWATDFDLLRRDKTKYKPNNYDNIADAIARPSLAYCDMTFDMGKKDRPAICMTQFAAKMYCKWLSAKTGRYYRLPTEAEWEYACRAGTKTAYSFGDDPEKLDDYGWHYDNSDEMYQKVGKKSPNPWGLYDIHGNVAEWVLDQHAPYKKNPAALLLNPLVPSTTTFSRCVRGGSWDDDPEALRSAARRGSEEDWKMQDPQIPQSIWYLTDAAFIGFRIVRPLKVPTAEQAKLYEPEVGILREYRESLMGREAVEATETKPEKQSEEKEPKAK